MVGYDAAVSVKPEVTPVVPFKNKIQYILPTQTVLLDHLVTRMIKKNTLVSAHLFLNEHLNNAKIDGR
jgi:hypothetical protein